MDQPRYVSIDDLQAHTSLAEAADRCGVTLEITPGTRQVRLDCLFGCSGDHAGNREISVDTRNPQKVFCCHAYGCQVRGNLLLLMHGWMTGTLPASGKLKGEEFKRVRDVLAGTASKPAAVSFPLAESPIAAVPETLRNTPLSQSENEKARELTTLDEKFIRDVGQMPPAAASYVADIRV